MTQKTIFLSIVLVLSFKAAHACTCLQISHRDEFRQSHAVFVAKVIEVKQDPSYMPPKLNVSPTIQKMVDSTKRYTVRLRIEKNFKGVSENEINLFAFTSDSGCSSVMFTQGETYLIYAARKNGQLSDGGVCSRTAKFDKTSIQYRELERSFRKWSKS